MKKMEIRGLIAQVILLIILSVVAFALPFVRTGVFWMAYLFGILAIAVQFYVFKVSFGAGEGARSKFYGMPIARVGVIYLAAQLVASLVEMAVSTMPVWCALAVNILLAAFAALGCLATQSVRDEVVRQDEQLEEDTDMMRRLQSLSAGLADACTDEEMKTLVKKLAEKFRYSDPVSAETTAAIERELEVQLSELKTALSAGNYEPARALIDRIAKGLAERNRCCALTK